MIKKVERATGKHYDREKMCRIIRFIDWMVYYCGYPAWATYRCFSINIERTLFGRIILDICETKTAGYVIFE